MTRTGMLLACCMALTACASPRASGGPLPQRTAAPELFVSPFGEPFSSEPGTPYPSAAWFDGADADASGEIDLAEFHADGRRYFAVLDGDGDQVLGIGEIAAYEAVMASLLGRIGGPPTARPGGSRPSGRPGDAPWRCRIPAAGEVHRAAVLPWALAAPEDQADHEVRPPTGRSRTPTSSDAPRRS